MFTMCIRYVVPVSPPPPPPVVKEAMSIAIVCVVFPFVILPERNSLEIFVCQLYVLLSYYVQIPIYDLCNFIFIKVDFLNAVLPKLSKRKKSKGP